MPLNSQGRVGYSGPYEAASSIIRLTGDCLMNKMLLAGMAAVALALAGCVSEQTYDASQQKNAELEKEYQDLNQSMSAEIGAKNMQISRLQDAIKVSIDSELLFPSGGWEMPADAQVTIAKIAAVLAPHQTTKIQVNGYTDSTPIGPVLMKEGITSNLILSQKRAENVMQYMISQGVNSQLISARGFGDADPVASNATPEGRAQNRRVELTLSQSQ
jgi:chemotaxis protein MotB